jgi:hypothetical protein
MENEKTLLAGEKMMIANVATSKLFAKGAPPVKFELNMVLTVGLIGQLQLAFRHPANNGPTREMIEKLVRDLIEQIDPARTEVYEFLMMGFNPEMDELAAGGGEITCRNCRHTFLLVRAIVSGFCPNCLEPICPACGCTSSAACADGCYWLPSGICSSCASNLE